MGYDKLESASGKVYAVHLHEDYHVVLLDILTKHSEGFCSLQECYDKILANFQLDNKAITYKCEPNE